MPGYLYRGVGEKWMMSKIELPEKAVVMEGSRERERGGDREKEYNGKGKERCQGGR